MQSLLSYPQDFSETAVIQPKGLYDSESADHFHTQLNQAISSNQYSKFLIDMEQVKNLDNLGLMTLVAALKVAHSSNKHFALCSVSHPVRMILELTQLDKIIEIVESPAIAVSAAYN